MWRKNSPQNVIDNYRKRQQFLPVIMSVLALLLVLIGVVIVILWITGGGFSFNLFGKKATPTQSLPPTPVLSPTPSLVPSESPTPTLTITPTPTGPFEYEVKENETCWGIAEKFDADFQTLLAINSFADGTCPIIPGQKILVPPPGLSLPTPTLIPPDLPSGTRITYIVQPGDSLGSIASKLNTTIDDILKLNEDRFDDINNIPIGAELIVRVNIVTPTPTLAPTSTRSS